MFVSFFPRPKAFFLSVLVWAAITVGFWYWGGENMGTLVGFPVTDPNAAPVIGLGYFITPQFLWFYIYCILCVGIFATAWFILSPHRWQWWAIIGSSLIIFSDYYSVQVSVALNNWRRPFFDAVQGALQTPGSVQASEFYRLIAIFASIAFVWMLVYVATKFFVSHYVFRWRTAMNDYYMSRWPKVRQIEGASQRIQEDTMRFASIVEDLGVALIDSIMTLFAFLPILYVLSDSVAELPIIGPLAHALLWASIGWSVFGTLLLAVAGIKLPGLNFRNQRVEAAYRKELVFGEDDENRAQPATVAEMFAAVRKNYFRLYFHYAYFNIFRGMYIQADNVFAYFILIPTIAAGKITYGVLQQILTAFGQVSGSFQYLVSSWTTIVELQSIYKRLRAFERAFEGLPQNPIESTQFKGEEVPMN
ncbi:MAG: peptide antibiotic transporter SbmA [Limimaricola sp.]|uniref:peptide antibiotic transporter SbmA n=1 Tax=Limimaricola sp. TaxID=2211665 RepID=UPI001DD46505|nr:peptide antibiotic transporter SbmA [Limimaricola sp.]MBI1417365.1 peptide antibiotic transporter SbmA [Limimaricola sp.]